MGVFSAEPSMDRMDRCRKADLYAIVYHFEFPVQGAPIKATLGGDKEVLGATVVACSCGDAGADV